jgi:hypothetical protein
MPFAISCPWEHQWSARYLGQSLTPNFRGTAVVQGKAIRWCYRGVVRTSALDPLWTFDVYKRAGNLLLGQ